MCVEHDIKMYISIGRKPGIYMFLLLFQLFLHDDRDREACIQFLPVLLKPLKDRPLHQDRVGDKRILLHKFGIFRGCSAIFREPFHSVYKVDPVLLHISPDVFRKLRGLSLF